ncbi:hypothetical protein KWX50_17370 [Clostridioides difficile]|nr:hypothetical protein [Clostridioides difficile]MBY2092331.1 hypothetical protein [Clostridioides difficile]
MDFNYVVFAKVGNKIVKSNKLGQMEFNFLQNFVDFFSDDNFNKEEVVFNLEKFKKIEKDFFDDCKEILKCIGNLEEIKNLYVFFNKIKKLNLQDKIIFSWE